jgi:hypothetical protein
MTQADDYRVIRPRAIQAGIEIYGTVGEKNSRRWRTVPARTNGLCDRRDDQVFWMRWSGLLV